MGLPPWIYPRAALSYVSSTGKSMDVIVKEVCEEKKHVLFVFACDQKTWKSVPFSHTLSKQSPLRERVAKPKTDEDFFESLEAGWSSPKLEQSGDAGNSRPGGSSQRPRADFKGVPAVCAHRVVMDVDSSPERPADQQSAAPKNPAAKKEKGPGQSEAGVLGRRRTDFEGEDPEPQDPDRGKRKRSQRRRSRSGEGTRRSRSSGRRKSRKRKRGRKEDASTSRSRSTRKKDRGRGRR